MMIIDDLEFLSICNPIESDNSSVIHGGASASVGTNTSATGSNVSASAGANASGDISFAITGTSAVLISQGIPGTNNGYTTGYAISYGAAYGVDRLSSFDSDMSISTSIV